MTPDSLLPPDQPYVARSAEDLLALVAPLIGFEPEQSLVMLTFGARRSFHARVDLPAPPDLAAWEEVADVLLDPAVRHGVRRVVLVLYTDRDLAARARGLRRRFRESGIEVLDVLRVGGGRWYSACGGGGVPRHGVPFDARTHPMRVRSVVDGRVVLPSRAAVAASLETDEPAARAVAEHLDAAVGGTPGEGVLDLLAALVGGSEPVGDEAVARLLLALADPEARDRIWSGLDRRGAVAQVGVWSEVLRRAPSEHSADAAAVLGFAAWLAGHGALAWCAVDRCREVAPHHRQGALVARLLQGAVPPAAWEEQRAG